jgi:hypothetical protein
MDMENKENAEDPDHSAAELTVQGEAFWPM